MSEAWPTFGRYTFRGAARSAATHMKAVLAVLFIVFHVCGFPFAAFGSLLAGAILVVSGIEQPVVAPVTKRPRR